MRGHGIEITWPHSPMPRKCHWNSILQIVGAATIPWLPEVDVEIGHNYLPD